MPTWKYLLLGLGVVGGLGVAYTLTRPKITAPTKPPPGKRGGYMVTWGSTGTDHWYPSFQAVKAEARRLGAGGTILRSGYLVGRVSSDGEIVVGEEP